MPPDRTPRQHVVRQGESLWAVAAAELGPEASDAAVADRWPQWYAANNAVVGPDPGLLRPGQVLRAPSRLPTHVSGQVRTQVPSPAPGQVPSQVPGHIADRVTGQHRPPTSEEK